MVQAGLLTGFISIAGIALLNKYKQRHLFIENKKVEILEH